MRSGMTQAQLSAIADVSQSVVSAYESDKREPSLKMLNKLVAATGFELALTLEPLPIRSPRRSSLTMNGPAVVRALTELGASNVRLFGSVARGDDGPNSDIDLLVDLRADVGLFDLGRMRGEAERLLGVSVDIVPSPSLKPEVAERVLVEALPLEPFRLRLIEIGEAVKDISPELLATEESLPWSAVDSSQAGLADDTDGEACR